VTCIQTKRENISARCFERAHELRALLDLACLALLLTLYCKLRISAFAELGMPVNTWFNVNVKLCRIHRGMVALTRMNSEEHRNVLRAKVLTQAIWVFSISPLHTHSLHPSFSPVSLSPTVFSAAFSRASGGNFAWWWLFHAAESRKIPEGIGEVGWLSISRVSFRKLPCFSLPRSSPSFSPPFLRPRPRASGHGEDRYDIADLTIAWVVLRAQYRLLGLI